MKTAVTILLFSVFVCAAYGQDSSYQNLYIVKNENATSKHKNDYQPHNAGFYIYRNCIYNFVLTNKLELSARVVDVRNDSIYYTNHINHRGTEADSSKTDTLSLHPSQLRTIRLIGDRTIGLYSKYSLKGSKFIFRQDTAEKRFTQGFVKAYSRDSSSYTSYELIPYMTQQGVDMLYEQCGKTYYFQYITERSCEDTTKKVLAKKKVVWFTPSNTSEIKGVNIGLQTKNFQDEPLTIKGVNLNADIMSVFVGFYSLFSLGYGTSLINFPDTIDENDFETRVHGVSLSFGGLAGGNIIKGVSINGGICSGVIANGLVVTGLQNSIGHFRGVVIGGLRNTSIKGAGMQIGIFNICKHLKGVQIGLWNVNSKRKLPFINWSL